jgi:Pyridine nucleotide-disulphide oxidoreductase
MLLASLVAVVAWASVASAAVEGEGLPGQYHRYVVVGSGAGGMQVGHYLQSAGRDYVILEKAAHAGAFFRRFPRMRRLISLNKRAAGSPVSDFNYRHDWNSLLTDPSHSALSRALEGVGTGAAEGVGVPARHQRANLTSSSGDSFTASIWEPRVLFRNFSRDYLPWADDLVTYLDAYAELRRLKIEYGASVTRVRRVTAAEGAAHPEARFAVVVGAAQEKWWGREEGAGAQRVVFCRHVVMAAGLMKPAHWPGLTDVEGVDTYLTAPQDPEAYAGQRVLIIGRGNAAFEVASVAHERSALTHVIGPAPRRIRLSWETHYPGDIRMHHAHLLETYMLKTLDGMAESNISSTVIVREEGTDDPAERFELDRSMHDRQLLGSAAPGGAFPPRFWVTDRGQRCTGRCGMRHAYDRVIVCLGWKFDPSVFDDSVPIALGIRGKLPLLTARMESVSSPGIWFAGSLVHSGDWKKASGGFIHGFRYMARALHRILEQDEEDSVSDRARIIVKDVGSGIGNGNGNGNANANTNANTKSKGTKRLADGAWVDGEGGVLTPSGVLREHQFVGAPELKLPGTEQRVCGTGTPHCGNRWPRRWVRGAAGATNAILHRINYASGIYQMFGFLSDVLVVAWGHKASFLYLEEVPVNLVPRLARQVAADVVYNLPESEVYRSPPEGERPVFRTPEEEADVQRRINEAAENLSNVTNLSPDNLKHHRALADVHYLTYDAQKGLLPLRTDEARLDRLVAAASPALPGARFAWIQVTLEYGANSSLPGRDAFSPSRAAVPVAEPERSHFMHPVMRLFVADEASDGRAPLLSQHLIEDFLTEFDTRDFHIEPTQKFVADALALLQRRWGPEPKKPEDKAEDVEVEKEKEKEKEKEEDATGNDATEDDASADASTETKSTTQTKSSQSSHSSHSSSEVEPKGRQLRMPTYDHATESDLAEAPEEGDGPPGGPPTSRRRGSMSRKLSRVGVKGPVMEVSKLLERLVRLGASVTTLWVGGERVAPGEALPSVVYGQQTVVALFWDRTRALGLEHALDVRDSRSDPTERTPLDERYSRGVHMAFSGLSRRMSARYPHIPFVDIDVGTQNGRKMAIEVYIDRLPMINVLRNGALVLSMPTASLLSLDAWLWMYGSEFSGERAPVVAHDIPPAEGTELGTEAATIILEGEIDRVSAVLGKPTTEPEDRQRLQTIVNSIKNIIDVGDKEAKGVTGIPTLAYGPLLNSVREEVRKAIRRKEGTFLIT